MSSTRYLPLLLSLTASAAWAAPGGTFEFKATSAKANGQIKIAVSGKNVRSDMEIVAPGIGPMQMSVLVKGEQSFLLNARDKSYSETNVANAAGTGREQKFTAKKLGTEKIGKWNTTHVELTDERGEKAEIWTTKDIDAGRSILEVLGQRTPGDAGMVKALASVGAEGFPVKVISGKREGLTLELVKQDSATPPAALFEIPADWKKTDAASAVAGGLPPEARKKLEEAMKNMTPEQRKAMEEAMKGGK